eukprot:scaffold395_cov243-Pinguiococcus_pyrenoidosus.AAC.27
MARSSLQSAPPQLYQGVRGVSPESTEALHAKLVPKREGQKAAAACVSALKTGAKMGAFLESLVRVGAKSKSKAK